MFNNFFRTALIFILLFTSVSCASTSRNDHAKDEKIPAEIKSEDEKVDVKKLAKEGAYMIGWDIVLAGACKAGLHFSVGVCLAADILGDVGIVMYSNLEPAEASEEITKKPDGSVVQTKDKNNSKISDSSKTEKITDKKQKKKSSINPLEFVLSVSLMAIILILI